VNHLSLSERYEVAEQSLLLQIQHNDLQLPTDQTAEQRFAFMKDVIVPLIVQQSLRCLAQPGTPVGIESATATGRISTQMNLNSFHSSGQLHTEVLQGVPRLNELFNATKEMKHPMMIVRFLAQKEWIETPPLPSIPSPWSSIPGFDAFHLFKQFTRQLLEHKTLLDVMDMNGKPYILYRPQLFQGLPQPEPYWYEPWRQVYGQMRAITMNNNPTNPEPQVWYTIRVQLDRVKLVQYQLSLSYIAQVIQESVLWAKTKKRFGSWTPILQVIASPDYERTLDIHVRVDHMPPLERIYRKGRLQQSRQGQILLDEERRRELFLSQVLMYDLSSVRLCGIPGIHEINWRTRSDPECLDMKKKNPSHSPLHPHEGWEVITRGSAFRDVILRPEIHLPSLFTNNPFEVVDVLGIEAARQLYLIEMRACMGSVDQALFHTAVDSMMFKGTITPANRFGTNPIDGPLTKASNEMSTQTLIRAGLTHQRESLNGVSASTMLAQPVRVGTGSVEIAWDAELWLELVKDKEQQPAVCTTRSDAGIDSLIGNLSLVTGHSYMMDMEEV
jgi:hypothetical protein